MTEAMPWCEKYRPSSFADIVLEPYNRKIFHNILEHKRFPHLLLYGPPGVGKTTSAENLIRAYQTKYYKNNSENVIHLNASDERGIEVIRNQIYQFVVSKNMFVIGIKFVILDEVDYMTKNAQQALKNLIQSCGENVRFCLICNYICKLEDSLKNEFICVRFNQLPANEITSFLQHIGEKEQLSLNLSFLEKIQNMYHSDIRSMINFLQLHQEETNWDKYLFHDDLWECLHLLFLESNYEAVRVWLGTMTATKCNIDTKTCIKKYFNYVVQYHISLVSYEFLNIAETILHSSEDDLYVTDFFIYRLLEYYKKIEK